MTSSLLNILSTIIIFQLLLMTFFLFSIPKGKKISNRLLAFFFFLLALNLSDGLLVYYGFYQKYPQLANLEDGFVFLFGPVLYFYTRSVVYRDFHFTRKDIRHAIPFITFTVLFQLFYHLQPEQYQMVIQSAISHQTLPPGFYFSIVLVYAHIFTYLYFAHREVVFYRQQIREKFSSLDRLNLDWLTFMMGSVAALMLLSFVYSFVPLTHLPTLFHAGLIVLVGFIFVFISLISWKALKQPEIFAGIETNEKYSKSSLKESDRESGLKRLMQLMNEEKPFLNPSLTIDQLAEKVGSTSKNLSQIINESFQQNFFDYINSFRIEEAKRIMIQSTDPKLTVLEVMYQAGFNSKSSFNTLFKKKTGLTPSEFKKNPVP